jgi:hypothetical protein
MAIEKTVPTYLDNPTYNMLKSMANEDMRSMAGFIKVLIIREGIERGLSQDQFIEGVK